MNNNIKIFIGIMLLALSFFASFAIASQIPKPEHPKPQFMREHWLNLNGQWNFKIDQAQIGLQQKWMENPAFINDEITVPFTPESKLSGVHFTDLIKSAWYHRTIEIPKKWKKKRVFLNFGAVDFDSRLWVNGQLVGRHYGGNVSFGYDITDYLNKKGKNDLVLYVLDDTGSGIQPRGKQSPKVYDPNKWSTFYMRVTGIWQTVWLEARADSHLEDVQIIPDLDNSSFQFIPKVTNLNRKTGFRIKAKLPSGKTITKKIKTISPGSSYTLDIPKARAWSPKDPYLYELIFELTNKGKVVDRVESYAGLRKFHIEGNKFYLNNKVIYLRFSLDQGYYPDGIWTAPSDEALRKDVQIGLDVGFNGARLHQKVFEERFHYWADKLGYLTMGEMADFGVKWDKVQGIRYHQKEWRESVIRDRNHPSIIAWTPFNETYHARPSDMEKHQRMVEDIYQLTKALDPTRPVHTVSGYIAVKETDIYSDHDYHQSAKDLAHDYHDLKPNAPWIQDHARGPELAYPYEGQPFFVAEYGGTFWDVDEVIPNDPEYWGYGKGVRTEIKVRKRVGRWIKTPNKPTAQTIENAIAEQTEVLLKHPHISGYVWTQLYDIEGEKNGIYTYDRKLKFDQKRMREIFMAPAAIEK